MAETQPEASRGCAAADLNPLAVLYQDQGAFARTEVLGGAEARVQGHEADANVIPMTARA